MKGQKEAVIEAVFQVLPNFVKGTDNALVMLIAAGKLEVIKASITSQILSGVVEYSKDNTNTAEVRTYARSMVMNHLKKAKELNGNTVHNSTANINSNSKADVTSPKGINISLLTDELKEFVKTL